MTQVKSLRLADQIIAGTALGLILLAGPLMTARGTKRTTSAILASNALDLSTDLRVKRTIALSTPGGDWTLEQLGEARGRLTADGPHMRVDVTRFVPGPSWQLQLSKTRVQLSQGDEYAVIFDMKSDEVRKVTLGVELADQPWTNLGMQKELELSDQWQHFDLRFKATVSTDNGRIRWDLGDSTQSVTLRDVSLRQVIPDVREVEVGH